MVCPTPSSHPFTYPPANPPTALYGQAYSDITENAVDEYLALFAHKTLQFIRAPDENVFLPPFNLVEIFGLILPFEWWLSKAAYARLNDKVMAVLYSPFMLMIAIAEARDARKVAANRAAGHPDDDETEEWEELQGEVDMTTSGWAEKVKKTVPDVEEDRCCQMVRALAKEVEELKKMVGGKEGGQAGEGERELLALEGGGAEGVV